jgi:hypothetical protein
VKLALGFIAGSVATIALALVAGSAVSHAADALGLVSTAAHAPSRVHLTRVPARPWVSRTARFAWKVTPKAATACRLDRGRWKACHGSKRYARLGLGRHVFAIRARRGPTTRFAWTIASGKPPQAPVITPGPASETTSTDASFAFTTAAGSVFDCRLDGGPSAPCTPPVQYHQLGLGSHTFCVRALDAGGVPSAEACLTWTIRASGAAPPPSGPFGISGDLVAPLSPGSSSALALTVSNPFGFDLRVTGLTVSVLAGSSRSGCDGPANLRVTQSNTADGSVSIVVPAHGSVTLPAQGATAPQVTMLNLDVNQNACKSAVFRFSYGGVGAQA